MDYKDNDREEERDGNKDNNKNNSREDERGTKPTTMILKRLNIQETKMEGLAMREKLTAKLTLIKIKVMLVWGKKIRIKM
jgi:hypothetical protein